MSSEMKKTEYVRALSKDQTHHGFKWEEGLNVDTLDFNTEEECAPGGLYFTTWEHLSDWMTYGDKIADVEIPEDAKVIHYVTKSKADKLILKNIRPMSTAWARVKEYPKLRSTLISRRVPVPEEYMDEDVEVEQLLMGSDVSSEQLQKLLDKYPESYKKVLQQRPQLYSSYKNPSYEISLHYAKMGWSFKHIPKEHQTKELITEALRRIGTYVFATITPEPWMVWVVLRDTCGWEHQKLPNMDEEMIRYVLSVFPDYSHIPDEYKLRQSERKELNLPQEEIMALIKQIPLLDKICDKCIVYGSFLRYILETYHDTGKLPTVEQLHDYIDSSDVDVLIPRRWMKFSDLVEEIKRLNGRIEFSCFSDYSNKVRNTVHGLDYRKSHYRGCYRVWIPHGGRSNIRFDISFGVSTMGPGDFTCNRNELGRGKISHNNPDDVRNRHIRLVNLDDHVGEKTIYRVAKLLDKGYTVPPSEYPRFRHLLHVLDLDKHEFRAKVVESDLSEPTVQEPLEYIVPICQYKPVDLTREKYNSLPVVKRLRKMLE